MPFWTMQWYHLNLSIVSMVKYPLVNFDKPLTRQYHQQEGPNFRAMLLSWTEKGRVYDGKANISF